jgi:hypothetical protein
MLREGRGGRTQEGHEVEDIGAQEGGFYGAADVGKNRRFTASSSNN